MSSAASDRDSMPGGARIWGCRALTAFALIWTVMVSLVVAGALLPHIRGVSPIATLLESFFSLHIVIAAVVGLALALAARRLGEGASPSKWPHSRSSPPWAR
jgi:hypothetical protein